MRAQRGSQGGGSGRQSPRTLEAIGETSNLKRQRSARTFAAEPVEGRKLQRRQVRERHAVVGARQLFAERVPGIRVALAHRLIAARLAGEADREPRLLAELPGRDTREEELRRLEQHAAVAAHF